MDGRRWNRDSKSIRLIIYKMIGCIFVLMGLLSAATIVRTEFVNPFIPVTGTWNIVDDGTGNYVYEQSDIIPPTVPPTDTGTYTTTSTETSTSTNTSTESSTSTDTSTSTSTTTDTTTSTQTSTSTSTSTNLTHISVWGDSLIENGTVETKFKMPGSVGNEEVILYFRLDGSYNGYAAVAQNCGTYAKLELYKVIYGGLDTLLSTATINPCDLTTGWHTLTVELSSIKVYLDYNTTNYINTSDPTYTSGKVAVGTNNITSPVYFDDVNYYSYSATTAPNGAICSFDSVNYYTYSLTGGSDANRSIWVWGAAYDIVLKPSDRLDFFNFCAAPHGDSSKAITTVFFDAKPYGYNLMTENPSELRQFLQEAHSRGMQVEFLSGDKLWASPEYRPGAETLIDEITSFNLGSTSIQRFDGVQYDVEPYLLNTRVGNDPYDWDYDKGLVWSEYLALLTNCQTRIDNYNAANDPDIRFGVAIPFWYVSGATTGPKPEDIINRVDYVAIMAYRNSASAIINVAQDEINYADSVGKKVYVGVETGHPTDTSGFPPSTTFYEEGNVVLEDALTQVHNTLSSHSSYAGIAIHYYEELTSPFRHHPSYRSLWTTSYLGHYPVVRVLSPNKSNEDWVGTGTLQWEATDLDGDNISIDIDYTPDINPSWIDIAAGLPNTGYYAWDTSSAILGPDNAIRITARDNSSNQLVGYDASNNRFNVVISAAKEPPKDLHLWNESSSSLRLKWMPPNCTPRYYKIYRSVNGAPFSSIPTYDNVIALDYFVDTGLSGTGKYKYKVEAVFGDGSAGYISNPSNMLIPGDTFLIHYFEENEGITYEGPWGYSYLSMSFDTANAIEGTQCKRFNYTYAGYSWGAISVGKLPVKVDISPYGAVKFWAKGGAVGGTAIKFQLEEVGRPEGNESWASSDVLISNTGWAEYEFNFSNFVRTSEKGNDRLDKHSIGKYGLVFSSGTANGTYYVDQIRLVPTGASISVPSNTYTFGIVNGTLEDHRFKIGPIQVTFGGHSSPWTVRMWTNNGFGPEMAGLVGVTNPSEVIPLKVWCVNFGPTESGPPDEENDYFYNGYDFGNGTNIGRQYQNGSKEEVYRSGTFDEKYWGFDINGNGVPEETFDASSFAVYEGGFWYRIPEDDEMTTNRYTWRRLAWTPDAVLLSPIDIYLAIDVAGKSNQQYQTTTLTLEYINE